MINARVVPGVVGGMDGVPGQTYMASIWAA